MNDNNKTEMIRALRNRTTKLQREGDYWDQEEIEKLKDMFNEGVGISDIIRNAVSTRTTALIRRRPVRNSGNAERKEWNVQRV